VGVYELLLGVYELLLGVYELLLMGKDVVLQVIKLYIFFVLPFIISFLIKKD
jgi:hypothetical protein